MIHGSRLDDFIQLFAGIRGWTWGEEARELARISFLLPAGSNIVEIGCFLGASTILLAGPRLLRGSGVVHCVDPFDCPATCLPSPISTDLVRVRGWAACSKGTSGTPVSILGRRSIKDARPRWDENWAAPIDLATVDGEESRASARESYDTWARF